MSDADWAMHSRLVASVRDKAGKFPNEKALRAAETRVLDEARAWKLDWHREGGRLSALELLAALQHYGVPSRMIDFTFNPVIALWFAVRKASNGAGRVFAIDISGKQVPPSKVAASDPWWFSEKATTDSIWATHAWVWNPPPLEPRIARQEACFVMGGIPSTIPRRNKRVAGSWRDLSAAEVRACMSIPFQLITYDRAEASMKGKPFAGGPAQASAFTLRIENKSAILREVEEMFGYTHRSLFPDFPGFEEYGESFR